MDGVVICSYAGETLFSQEYTKKFGLSVNEEKLHFIDDLLTTIRLQASAAMTDSCAEPLTYYETDHQTIFFSERSDCEVFVTIMCPNVMGIPFGSYMAKTIRDLYCESCFESLRAGQRPRGPPVKIFRRALRQLYQQLPACVMESLFHSLPQGEGPEGLPGHHSDSSSKAIRDAAREWAAVLVSDTLRQRVSARPTPQSDWEWTSDAETSSATADDSDVPSEPERPEGDPSESLAVAAKGRARPRFLTRIRRSISRPSCFRWWRVRRFRSALAINAFNPGDDASALMYLYRPKGSSAPATEDDMLVNQLVWLIQAASHTLSVAPSLAHDGLQAVHLTLRPRRPEPMKHVRKKSFMKQTAMLSTHVSIPNSLPIDQNAHPHQPEPEGDQSTPHHQSVPQPSCSDSTSDADDAIQLSVLRYDSFFLVLPHAVRPRDVLFPSTGGWQETAGAYSSKESSGHEDGSPNVHPSVSRDESTTPTVPVGAEGTPESARPAEPVPPPSTSASNEEAASSSGSQRGGAAASAPKVPGNTKSSVSHQDVPSSSRNPAGVADNGPTIEVPSEQVFAESDSLLVGMDRLLRVFRFLHRTGISIPRYR
eukprot:Rmarinus@m.27606